MRLQEFNLDLLDASTLPKITQIIQLLSYVKKQLDVVEIGVVRKINFGGYLHELVNSGCFQDDRRICPSCFCSTSVCNRCLLYDYMLSAFKDSTETRGKRSV
jgi:hypothetical protein